jgi:hypothetical protein
MKNGKLAGQFQQREERGDFHYCHRNISEGGGFSQKGRGKRIRNYNDCLSLQ